MNDQKKKFLRGIRKRQVSMLFLGVMFLVMAGVTVHAEASGTKNDPYVATTYQALQNYFFNAPTDGTCVYIKLGNDITQVDEKGEYVTALYIDTNQKIVLI